MRYEPIITDRYGRIVATCSTGVEVNERVDREQSTDAFPGVFFWLYPAQLAERVGLPDDRASTNHAAACVRPGARGFGFRSLSGCLRRSNLSSDVIV